MHVSTHARAHVCVCVSVCVCVCVCVCEREREREREYVCAPARMYACLFYTCYQLLCNLQFLYQYFFLCMSNVILVGCLFFHLFVCFVFLFLSPFFLGGGGEWREDTYIDGMLQSKFHLTGMKYYLTLLTSG